jgi:hypothetical protein
MQTRIVVFPHVMGLSAQRAVNIAQWLLLLTQSS